MSKLRKTSKRLEARIKAWEGSKQCQDYPQAYHKPGSNKK